MRKRIYINMLAVLFACVLLLSASLGYIFYNTVKKQEIEAIRDRAALIADLLNSGLKGYDDPYNSRFTDFISGDPATARVCIISPDGKVVLDNKNYADYMENHGDREEIREATISGVGESTRYSETLGSMNYYYALLLYDGYILRVSKPLYSISGIFTAVLPTVAIIAALVLLASNVAARRLTAFIVRPINDIDFDGENIAVYDELSPYLKKITQQKNQLLEQFSANETRANTIDAITGNMKEGLILVDREGAILSANVSAQEIFNESEMVGRNILHICRDAELLQKMRLCLSGRNEESFLTRGAKTYNIYLNPVHQTDDISGAVILFLDTTEKYEAEKQRKEFSANVSHELKTPLTTISALSEMIENGMAKEDDVKGFAAKISEQTKRLIDIIDDIIKLSEFDEGNISRAFTLFDLYELAGSVVSGLQNKAAEKNVTVSIEGERLQITANRRMIDELLYNLIDNGIKYNKDGGGITVGFSGDKEYCRISVADTGIGIAKEHHGRVFERFYRVDKSRSKRISGTGLGLSIVKHIVEYHKGKLELESHEGKGTVVVCYIPVRKSG